jgi:hypothetical protein
MMPPQRLLEFKIHKDRDGEWDFEDDLGDDVEFRFKFALHTGTESPEVRDIIRNIYNNSWELYRKK